MEDGLSLYQGMVAAIESDDMGRVAAFARVLEKKGALENLSFYALDALASELRRYVSRLESADTRGLKGRGRGATKNDVLAACRRVLKELLALKDVKKERIKASQPDHTELFREFLPREFTRNMDRPPPSVKKPRVKSG